MSRPIHREQQIDFATVTLGVAERLVQALVAVLGGAPNLVFDAAMNVVLGIGLYDEESANNSGWKR